jgi:hypothetical protein
MANSRIIQIGFNRCGTSSLNYFFMQHGFKCIHWDDGNIARTIKRNCYLNKPVLEGYEDYNFISDMELVNDTEGIILAHMDYFKEIESQYPEAKFILNTRNMHDWISSRAKHSGTGHHNYLERYMRIWDMTAEQVTNRWMRDWYAHHAAVLSYFQGKMNKLLIFDIDRPDYENLSNFSGLPITSVKFPKLNSKDHP